MGLAGRGAKLVRPYAEAVRGADVASHEGGRLSILPGDPAATVRLREMLGSPEALADEDALALLVAAPETDIDIVAPALARRRHSGGGALAIVAGRPARRATRSRPACSTTTASRPPTSPGCPPWTTRASTQAMEAVVRALGDDATAAARIYPALRGAVGRTMVARASRRAGLVGLLPLPGVDLPVLALIQVRLVADLAAIHDRPAGADRAIEAVAVVGAGFGWRALSRSASGLVPGVGWAVRGTVAYGATRAVGEAALVRAQAGHDLIEGAPIDKVRPVIDRVLGRLRR